MTDHFRFHVTFRTLRGPSPEPVNVVCRQVGGGVCGVTFSTLRGLSPRAVTVV